MVNRRALINLSCQRAKHL